MVDRYVLAEDFKCKYCGSKNLWLYGTYHGNQRFSCRDCKRKFAGNYALLKMKSPITHVGDALQSYFSGMSLNEVRYNIQQQHDYLPSASTIYRWLDRFIKEAKDKVKDTQPNVGDTWVADETVIKIAGKNYWLFDCIDSDTRFLLASHLSPNRGIKEARALTEKAEEQAGKNPKVVVTDKYVCDDYKRLHTQEATGLILIKSNMGVTIVGKKEIDLHTWDNLIHQLPDMVRHSCHPRLRRGNG